MDLYFRKIVRNQGQALGIPAPPDQGDRGRGGGQRPAQEGARGAVARATDNVEAIVNGMHGYYGASIGQPGEINKIGLNTTRLLLALGDLIIGWLLVRQAEVALAALDGGAARSGGPGRHDDTAFYTGKVAAARILRGDRAAQAGRRARDRREPPPAT